MKGPDLIGKRFGRLVVLARVGTLRAGTPTAASTWRCRCDCGSERVVLRANLTSGNTTSCGCRRLEILAKKKHGWTGTALYRVWRSMIERCHGSRPHKDYGARGITVCKRWRTNFSNFLADMGPRPPGFTLERVNNDKGYSPKNCVWASRIAQANNRRSNRWIEVDGERHTAAEWARLRGLDVRIIYSRIQRGLEGAALVAKSRPRSKWWTTPEGQALEAALARAQVSTW